MTSPSPAPIDLHNIQGDILAGLPKKTETFLFFKLTDPSQFRKHLGNIVPLIKTAAQVTDDRSTLKEHKRKAAENGCKPELLPLVGVNIAFSQAGLMVMGFKEDLGDSAFKSGQINDASNLGDPGHTEGTKFVPDWDPVFKNNDIHGVIDVAGESHHSVDKKLHDITQILGPSIHEITRIRGDVRPGKNSGHEHFGFLDGISNPAVAGFDTTPFPGQETVAQTVILTGLDATANPPALLVDGSFLVFRLLNQLVPEFDQFLTQNPILAPNLTMAQGSELLGARLVGRWKSGAPIDLSPLHDDPALAADPQRNNNFRFQGELAAGNQEICPYSAHIRKTNPRADLEDQGFPTESRRIIRRGIQFGPEVTLHEKQNAKTEHDRGLLFVSYQSSIVNGFQFIQHSWANTQNFPPNAKDPKGNKVNAGFDPIIGQAGTGTRSVLGTDPAQPDGNITLPIPFVVPRGGEYFFVPSVAALRDVLAEGVHIVT